MILSSFTAKSIIFLSLKPYIASLLLLLFFCFSSFASLLLLLFFCFSSFASLLLLLFFCFSSFASLLLLLFFYISHIKACLSQISDNGVGDILIAKKSHFLLR